MFCFISSPKSEASTQTDISNIYKILQKNKIHLVNRIARRKDRSSKQDSSNKQDR